MAACAEKKAKHFVLVHGACHGAWCWYKLTASLRSGGHRVTAMDLGASGIDVRTIDDIGSFSEYEQPLVDAVKSIPDGEKVVLVGHSFGGFGLAHVMEMFPEKIEVAIFLTAFLPNATSPPSSPLLKCFEGNNTTDIELTSNNGYLDKMFFGPKAMATILYQLCPMEDYTLALSLVRQTKLFAEELSRMRPFSEEAFGSVRKAYVVCKGDLILTEEFQRWMVERSPVDAVREIEGADHMAMLSAPQELHACLMDIVHQ